MGEMITNGSRFQKGLKGIKSVSIGGSVLLNKNKDILFLKTRNWGYRWKWLSLIMEWGIVKFRELIPDHDKLLLNTYLLNVYLFYCKIYRKL